MENWRYVIEAIGIIGAIEVLIAYGLNSYQKIKSDSLGFYLLNLTGGIFLIIYTWYKEAWASMFVNVIWAIIAIIAVGKLFMPKKEKGKTS
jgi:hypothetical protein